MNTTESSLFGDAAPTAPEAGGEYRVLARKYRPRDFTDLIGQGPMVRTLTNAFETGRIAQAYMLTGVRGVGKTTTARILARALNYETDSVHQPTIDLSVPGIHCQAIIEGRHVDVIEMDAASHTGIDDIREIIEQVRYRPVSARYKVYIIDEVHMLSTQAFNGLLKTLEEPPPHVKFIFATTEIRKVPITVLSRCQRFDLRRIDADLLVHHFRNIAHAENVPAEDEALAMIARASEGSARDGLSLMDQAIAHGAGHIETVAVRTMLGLADRGRIVELFDRVVRGKVAEALEEFAEQYEGGANPPVVLTDLADFTHLVTRLKFVPEAGRDASLSETERSRGADYAASLSVSTLSRLWQMLLKGIPEVEASMRPYAAAEMVLIRLTHAASLPSPEDAVRRFAELAEAAGAENDATKGAGTPQSGTASTARSTAAAAPAQAAPSRSDVPPPSPREDRGDRPGPVAPQRQAGSALRQAEPQREARSDAAPAPQPVADDAGPRSLDDLVALAAQHRDIKMKTLIRTCLRLVRLEPGRIEANLTPDTPKAFAGDLMGALEKWTGRRWMVSVSGEEGAPTLAEAEATRRDGLVRDAREDPDVAAILKRFPGARITDVRIESDDASDLDLASDVGADDIGMTAGSDDPDGDTLDD